MGVARTIYIEEEEEILLYCNKQYIIGREARRPGPEAIWS